MSHLFLMNSISHIKYKYLFVDNVANVGTYK